MAKLSSTQKINKKVEILYNKADALLIDEVERLAREILAFYPDLNEFIMGMGVWCFTFKKGNRHIDANNSRNYTKIKELDAFINNWNREFKITGEPMRFTLNSFKETNF